MTQQNIYFIWLGEKELSPLQFLSFKSFSSSGKNLILYTDNLKRMIPKEIPIELKSYKDIDPQGEIIRYGSGTAHRSGSPVLYTNLLRYLLLSKEQREKNRRKRFWVLMPFKKIKKNYCYC